jgi:hypothetical protein
MEGRRNERRKPGIGRKVAVGAAAVGMLVGAGKLASGSESVPCDPMTDNGCVVDPNDPNSTAPTLPPKEATTVPSTTEPPVETTVPPTTQPPVETTVPPTTVPPAQPPEIIEMPPASTVPTPPSVGKSS